MPRPDEVLAGLKPISAEEQRAGLNRGRGRGKGRGRGRGQGKETLEDSEDGDIAEAEEPAKEPEAVPKRKARAKKVIQQKETEEVPKVASACKRGQDAESSEPCAKAARPKAKAKAEAVVDPEPEAKAKAKAKANAKPRAKAKVESAPKRSAKRKADEDTAEADMEVKPDAEPEPDQANIIAEERPSDAVLARKAKQSRKSAAYHMAKKVALEGGLPPEVAKEHARAVP